MRSEVRVVINEQEEFKFDLNAAQPLPHDVARAWLDQQFTELDCEPLRASGKVLLADKVLVVAQAAGARLLADAAWGTEFARATSAVLDKPVVVVDLAAMTLSY
jgi:hypothetical protein